MKYFTIKELCTTTCKEDNTPSNEVVHNLTELVDNVLDKLRLLYGKPIKINSGYRSIKVNKLVGGVSNSHHILGTCADITAGNKVENKKLFDILKSKFKFRQLINEKDYTWIHIEYKSDDNKCEILKIN